MLQDLDVTLRKLLTQNLAAIDRKVSISFDTPNRESIKITPAVNLFLYDIRENLDLRSGTSTFERLDNGTAIKKRAPVLIDCAYLITAWTTLASDPTEEHSLLGDVMTILLRYPRLPESVLQNSLVGQQPPIRTKTLRSSQLQSLGEFWQAMGGKPKATLNYTVTLSMPVHEDSDPIPLISEIEEYGQRKPNRQVALHSLISETSPR